MKDNFELMHSYPDFPKDVIEVFRTLTIKYKLKPTADGICSVNFDNQFCRLNFNMDRYDLQGLFYCKRGLIFKKIETESQSINQIVIMLFPDSNFLKTFPKTTYGNKDETRQLLFWYADIVEKYLESVLIGDFSSLDKMLKKASL
jgi:hypothetical protein